MKKQLLVLAIALSFAVSGYSLAEAAKDAGGAAKDSGAAAENPCAPQNPCAPKKK